MKTTDLFVATVLLLCAVSVLPLWKEPFFHRDKVDFWEWLKRELVEMVEGEKE